MATNPVSGPSSTPSSGPVASNGSTAAAQMASTMAAAPAASNGSTATAQMASTMAAVPAASNGSTAAAQMASTMAAATAAFTQGFQNAFSPQSGSPAVPTAPPAMLPLVPLKAVQGKKKRKNAAPAINIMRRKRIRPTLIDDRVVISIFRELRLTRSFIHSGALLAWSLPPTHPDFNNIHDYLERGQEHGYGLKIISILRIIPAAPNLADDNILIDFNDNPNTKGQNRMMLWHGTKRRCLPNILENGLRLPAYGGQMFGPGIYFADRVSKSSNYCDPGADGGYLWLCDVLIGTTYEAFGSIPRLRSAPRTANGVQTQSVVGLGKRIPDPGWNMTIDGTVWPMGRTIDRNDNRAYLQFNEYVVYDVTQVRPKYLIKFELTQNPVQSILY